MMAAEAQTAILVVEDEALVAVMLEDMIRSLGARVIGPALKLDRACELARTESFAGAVLDVSIRGESVAPVIEILAGRDIPFVLATGYGGRISQEWPEAPVVEKPYLLGDLMAALAAVGIPVGNRPGRGAP